MTNSTNQPQEHDAVLGGQIVTPVGGVVLGGLAGIQQRFSSDVVEHRISALRELQRLDQPNLNLLIRALQDPAVQVQKMAYFMLQSRSEVEAQAAIEQYSPYKLFECLYTLRSHTTGITATAIGIRHFLFRADQEVVVSADRHGVVKIWDLQLQDEVFSVDTKSFVYAISIDSDEDIFITRGSNQKIKAWSFKTEQEVEPTLERIRNIASVTSSGSLQEETARRYLISGSQNTIKVWDLKAGQEVCALRGHSSLVTAVAVSDNQQRLISGSEDKTVKVWGIA